MGQQICKISNWTKADFCLVTYNHADTINNLLYRELVTVPSGQEITAKLMI